MCFLVKQSKNELMHIHPHAFVQRTSIFVLAQLICTGLEINEEANLVVESLPCFFFL